MKQETRELVKGLVRAAINDPAEREEVLAALRERKPEREKLVNGQEAARIAGITRRTLALWEKKGWVRGRHITPRRVRFSVAELEEFLSRGAAAEA